MWEQAEGSELGKIEAAPCINAQGASKKDRADLSYNLLTNSALELGHCLGMWADIFKHAAKPGKAGHDQHEKCHTAFLPFCVAFS